MIMDATPDPSTRRRRTGALIGLLAMLLLAACGGNQPAAPTAPAAPTVQLSAQGYFEQGNTLYEQGDLQAAVAAYRQAAALEEQNAGYWHNLGVAYYALDALEEARTSFQRGLALAPDDPQLNYLMGVVSIQFGALAEAESYLTRANQLSPTLPEPYFGLGVLYRLLNQPEQAIRAFETFLEIGPGQDPSAMPAAEAELEALRANAAP